MNKDLIITLKNKDYILLIKSFTNLLNLINIECKGEKVVINEIRQRNENRKDSMDIAYNLDYQSIQTVKAKEPRIYYIAKQLNYFLEYFELLIDGKSISIDGFRLKNLKDWLIPMKDSPYYIFQYTTWPCNANCTFCFQKGNPDIIKKSQKKYPTLSEINTRIKYYSVEEGHALFNQSWLEIDEVLIHPHILSILEIMRKKSKQIFQFATNGSMLTESMILNLKKVMPIRLGVSLNSANLKTRKIIMNDSHPEVAIESLRFLKKHKIPYFITIAMWPTISFEDMYNTMKYAQENDAYCLKVFLPGYSSIISKKPLFDHHKYWGEIVTFLRKIRNEFELPLICVPDLYEEWTLNDFEQKVIISGIIKNSPAYFQGLRLYDEVIEVNDIKVDSRITALNLLFNSSKFLKHVKIKIKRNNEIITYILEEDTSDENYPYISYDWANFGIYISMGISKNFIYELKNKISKYNAEKVLLFSSLISKPFIEKMIKDSKLLDNINIDFQIQVPPNIFYGGNIIIGSMFVTDDYINFLESWIILHGKPDLVLIPSGSYGSRASSGWYRDVTGRYYKEIERILDINVELVESDYYINF